MEKSSRVRFSEPSLPLNGQQDYGRLTEGTSLEASKETSVYLGCSQAGSGDASQDLHTGWEPELMLNRLRLGLAACGLDAISHRPRLQVACPSRGCLRPATAWLPRAPELLLSVHTHLCAAGVPRSASSSGGAPHCKGAGDLSTQV